MDLNVYNIHAIVGLFGSPHSANYFANIERGIDTSGVLVMDYGSFKAVSIGAKDCKSPIISTIQGERGFCSISSPVNNMFEFRFSSNQGEMEDVRFEATHRLLPEFQFFTETIDKKDYDLCNKMMKISLDVIKLMENTRLEEGIRFAEDNQ